MSAAAMEMPPTTVASTALSRELWKSFASLLRSHVAMRALARPAADWRILASSEEMVGVEACGRTLRAVSTDACGTGTIEFNANSAEIEIVAFFFSEDGRLHMKVNPPAPNQQGMEMEAAVESLLDRVCR